ncbi:Cys-loop ligand-gated ion channel [Schistosoma japonicum]|nr:Cys-loop ligand-gated ion channel [Schistosoma japonicum]KAH8850229.1 Cys-loop ligand-gated ion channel [Schistosoma japonicum]
MSINFNKLFLQDILSRRESSHAIDLNEENVKEECEYSTEYNENDEVDESDDVVDDEYDYGNESEVSNYTDDGTEISKNKDNNKTTNNLLSGEDSQRFRLISALNDLRLAVDKQANLQSLLNDCKNKVRHQDYKLLSKLSTVTESQNTTNGTNDEASHLMAITPSTYKIDTNRCIESADEEKVETTSPNNRANHTTATCKSLKKQTQHNTMDIPIPLMDKDTLGFRRNERLSKRKERVSVQIRVVFLKIGEIDTLKEIFHADAFIQAKWREPRLDGKTDENLRKIDLQRCWNPLILIDNILSESKEQHWIITERNEHDEIFIVERRRLRGVFLETLELNDFPLDVQDLTITLTSERPESEVELIPDKNEPCRINLQSLVDQQEWRLHEHIEVTRRSATQEYTHSSQSHPCISVTCRAARRPGYFYWNVFLIMFFITGLSFATFAVPPERPENRLQLSFTLFLTSVAFKFVINQSLPKISYLTYMDKYVLMSLAILCVVSIWHAVVTLIPSDAEFEQLTTKNLLKSTDPQFSFMKRYKELTYPYPSTLTAKSQLNNDISIDNNKDNTSLMQTDKSTKNNHITTLESKESYDVNHSSKFSQQLNQQTWIALALQSKNREQHKRRLMMRIERDVFVSFCILYILAHLTFIFWLYFDASRRRREMVERDRLYKKCLQASKVL